MQKFDKQVKSINDYADEIDDYKDSMNFFHDELQQCYKIVEDFIKRNKRLLVGGMEIDFALKAKGSFLYTKDKIDYDFISPDYHTDAYNLGNLLAKQFDGISVIGALHASTMRVRYKFMAVADITYVPLDLYNKIETVEFQGFTCVHPHYQMMDQMRSIIYMAENPPRESFFGDRISKDIKRFCMLADKYPLLESHTIKTQSYSVPTKWLKGNCLGGLPAAAYWSKKLNLQTKLNIDIDKSNTLLELPIGSKITIYSDEPDKLVDLIHTDHPDVTKRKYRAILDKLPERIEIDLPDYQLEILDSSTSYLLAESLNDIHIVQLCGVLMYLLVNNMFTADQSVLPIIFKAVHADFVSDISTLPESPKFYGKNNWSETYLLSTKKHISGKASLPRNAYPEKNKPVSADAYQFDLSSSEILKKDGSIYG